MTAGFHLTEVRFRGGTGVQDAIVTFGPGLSVVAGPSNTGKSLVRSAINFVFGAGEMKNVEEAAPYRSIFVEIKTAAGSIFTFERAWNGGDIRQYAVPARDIKHNTPSTVLAAKHSAENHRNISNVLLLHSGLAGTKILRYKSSGETRNLSFRDLVEYLLISEERIITELSPIHTDDVIAQTAESSIFRILLSGKDDKDIITAPSRKEEKAQAAGRGVLLLRLREDLKHRMPRNGITADDVRRQAAAIDARINEQSTLLENYRTDLTALEEQRRTLQAQHEQRLTRSTQIDANLRRFTLLAEQYDSDLRRLQSNVEAGSLFGDFQEGPCPVCGAEPEHHQQHEITQEQLDAYTTACRAEAEKLGVRQADLAATMAQLQSERNELQTQLREINEQRTQNQQALKAVLEPSIASVDNGLATLVEQRRDIERTIAAFEELARLNEIEQSLRPAPRTRGRQTQEFATLAPNAYEEFARQVETLLRAWSFPELDRVVFDTEAEDIVVSGKARSDNGKGYRAITYAAFMIALLLETNRKDLPHPGFVILDSPLVTYREPEEHIGEGVKNAFYRSLATSLGDAQVIILENEEPPEELKAGIAYTAFTKNRTVGRYGLFPPLPVQTP